MRYFKYGIFILSALFFVVSCITSTTPVPEPTKKPEYKPRPDTYYIDRRNRDTDRDEVIRKAKDRRRGDLCEDDKDCEEICDDIFNSRREEQECEEFSVAQVEQFEIIHETLENPDEDDLDDIDTSPDGDFDVFINIDVRPIERLFSRYNSREAEDVLIWIANNPDVANIFEKEDRDYSLLQDLLRKLNTDYFTALRDRIDGNDNFLDLAVIAENEIALEWIHNFLEDEESDCSGNTEAKRVACLEKYCVLGDAMDEDNAQELTDYEYFERYLDEIIEDGINGDDDTNDGQDAPDDGDWDNDPGSNNRLEDVRDIVENWWEELC